MPLDIENRRVRMSRESLEIMGDRGTDSGLDYVELIAHYRRTHQVNKII